jgi:thiol:disulfide interchange protein/DsbC/DsbD-like thiol-disulfide interchange protein
MIRTFLLFLIAGSLSTWASEPITATCGGASETVSQPHVTAELIPQSTLVSAGQSFDVILHLHMDPGWHTYWINPGDAGLATTIDWTLPPGFIAGPIQWPTPEKHNMGPLITYGYAGDVYLLTTITPPKSELPKHFDIKAHASWLVCQEECIPGEANLTLALDTNPLNLRLPVDNKDFFAAARARLPVPNTRWDVKAAYGTPPKSNPAALFIEYRNKPGAADSIMGNLYFFPEQANVLNPKEGDIWEDMTSQEKSSGCQMILALQQNGEKPAQISGVLVSDHPLIGDSKEVYISPFPTNAKDISMEDPMQDEEGPAQKLAAAHSSLQAVEPPPWLGTVLSAAFVGGLILNLMPCVLPVLSLKVFSLMRHAGENPRAAWIQGVAFTAGVVISFWVLAGLLLVFRAAGNQFGWGFQMQSSGFVLALIFIFFLLALNLFGVFEFGTSLVGVDAKATNHLGGLLSSFLNGALATVAATPCTAPSMGWALGFAAQQPPFVALLIFTFLALGMATPYLLLTIFPGALRFVPKPGAWMEALKQFMGFLLMATVIFLVYVFGALVGQDQVPWLLMVLLLAGVSAWIYGRWGTPGHSRDVGIAAIISSLVILYYSIDWGIDLAFVAPPPPPAVSHAAGQEEFAWQPWSPVAVDAELAKGRPVFVDFTAAWCLSCKVNERLALDTDSVRAAFVKKNVALFRADWTHSDPEISKTLRQFNRDGVPLYLLYSPRDKSPRVLPEVLTSGIVLQALQDLSLK